MTDTATKKRVLSGMRATGKLHLGNYVGALANWVKLQERYECFFFIADWHALTTDYADTSRVKQNSLEVILDWLAAGLDPEKCVMFVQSHVLEHAELHLLFSMITPLPWLERVPTYKEQQQQLREKDLNTYGFLGYPLLQAADILIYRANFVPVGEDQVAHIELTREVARRFNQFYKGPRDAEVLPEPQPLLTPAARLPGTDGRKMSKSYNNYIELSEPSARPWSRIRRVCAAPIPAILTSARLATCTRSFLTLRPMPRCRPAAARQASGALSAKAGRPIPSARPSRPCRSAAVNMNRNRACCAR